MIKFISNSQQKTAEFASFVAKKIKKGTTLLLFGDLGAGKTTFSKQLIKSLGIKDVVTSPTFTILNEYQNDDIKINHFDMYRLEDESEAEEIGFVEIINDKNAINLIEWPQKVLGILPKNCKKLSINVLSENEREFVLEGFDD